MNLNEAIAKSNGWIKHQVEGICDDWLDPDNNWQVDVPDYLNDARLYMGLFEEMRNSGFEFRLESDTTGSGEAIYTVVILEQRNDTNGTGWGLRVISTQYSIGTAICLAYCKLNGLECEG